MDNNLKNQLHGLTLTLNLGKQARQSQDLEMLRFVMVNETRTLIPYRQAVLWQRQGTKGKVMALSGLPVVDANTPFVGWLIRLFDFMQRQESPAETMTVRMDRIPSLLGDEWVEWLPEHALFVPLKMSDGSLLGGLLFARAAPWSEGEARILDQLAEIYAHAWTALDRRSHWRQQLSQRWCRIATGNYRILIWPLLVAFVVFFPVRHSVLPPAEVTAVKPSIVRAPLEGVIQQLAVLPNEVITKGQQLFTLDPTTLQNRWEVARKEAAIIQTKYEQVTQQVLIDDKNMPTLNLLDGEWKRKQTEVAYLESLLKRIQVHADRDGIVIFEDVNDWIGKPVVVGERIMEIADPKEMELDIHLPVADAIRLEDGAEVQFFLNVSPHQPVPARLYYTSYKARPTKEGILAYRLKAIFTNKGNILRIGLKGTAKIYGEQTVLIEYLLRRPWASLRLWLGV